MQSILWEIGRLHPPKLRKRGRNFSGTIIATVGTMVAAALVAAGVGLFLATSGSDEISVERQARSVQHAMQSSIDEVALQQETVAIWDNSAEKITSKRLDRTWIHDNIGSWLHRIFRQDEVFILDAGDRPLYAAADGKVVSPQLYASLSRDLRHLVCGVRGRDGLPNGIHDRHKGRPLPPDSTVRTTPRATHDSHMLLIGGRPAAASAMLIQPSTPGYVKVAGNWPILISIRYLDKDFLEELSSRQLIATPRFSRTSRRVAEEYAVPLVTQTMGTIGYLIWRPELPGTRIFWKILPLNVTILTALALFIGILGRRLRRAGDELAAAEEQAARLALHDPLTGLANRALFQKTLDQLAASSRLSAVPFGLILLDVDDFKLTNDTLGHDAGDALLMALADRLNSAVCDDDLVARLGGDEFALLLNGIGNQEALEAFATDLLQRLLQPCSDTGDAIHCRASVGGSLHEPGGSVDDLLKRADLALYAAKRSRRGGFRLYEPAMKANMLARASQMSGARDALERNLIRPYYQPKVDLASGRIVGFEALLRSTSTEGEIFGPDRIAAALEDPSLAPQLGERMIDQVINDILAWRTASVPFGHVALNAAAAELRLVSFAPALLAKLAASGIPTACVQIEVTESVLLGRAGDHVEQTLMELAAGGIKLGWDDFGTGFASLSHLKQYPVGVIKIDRTFVRDVQSDHKNGAIVTAILELARTLDIDVIAEGIETAAQCDFLRALGCNVGQGYLFGTAVPASEVPKSLDTPFHWNAA